MRQPKVPKFDIQRYRAIVFDFDGTLVPCLDLRAMKERLLNFTVSETGIDRKIIEPLMMVEFIEHTSRWLHDARQSTNYFNAAHQMIRDIELTAAAETTLFPGTKTLLNSLRAHELKIGIVTRNCEQAVRVMFPDVDDICSSIVARDQARYLKPDPRHLQQCLDELNTPPSECLMVGDGIIDIEIAQALKMDSLAVSSGHNSIMELQAARPTWLMSHVNNINSYLMTDKAKH